MTAKYLFYTLGMLGQMYDEADEEVNFPKGTWFYLASDIDQLFEKDSARTKEHNLLVQENRALQAQLGKVREKLLAAVEPWLGVRGDLIPASVAAIVPLCNELQAHEAKR